MSYITFEEFIKTDELINSRIIIDEKGRLTLTKDDVKGDHIKASYGKAHFEPYRTSVHALDQTINVLSLYSAQSPNILKKIKEEANNGTDFIISFIDRSAIYGKSIMNRFEVDVIITPKSSSMLNQIFAHRLGELGGAHVILDAFIKQLNIEDISIDYEHPGITKEIQELLENKIKIAKQKGYFNLKSIPGKFRKFLDNMFMPQNNEIIREIENKNVLIIDDIITTGTSINQIAKKTIGIVNSINCMTMFKSVS